MVFCPSCIAIQGEEQAQLARVTKVTVNFFDASADEIYFNSNMKTIGSVVYHAVRHSQPCFRELSGSSWNL